MSEPLQQVARSTQREFFYDGRAMITETDLRGRITFVNRKFTEMSGYPKHELIGRPHSIIRHPDMPATCFKLMWQTIRSGKSWQGYVKNRRKDGNFYWVIVHIVPKIISGEIVGYIAVRKKPEPQTLEQIKKIYAEASVFEIEGDHYGAEKLISATARIDAHSFPQEALG
jgi:aerotaxis receptor